MATVAEEKLKHSVIYASSTSEIKDDCVQLVACLKTNAGALTRQEAAFLIWHHALNNEDKLTELLNNNIISACLVVLDAPESTPVDKSCCAGVLAAIAQTQENREAVIRGKTSSTNSTALLHRQLHTSAGDLERQYAARTLRLIVEEPASKSVMLKVMEQRLQYLDLYTDALLKCSDSTTVAHVCAFLKTLFTGRDDLKGEAIQGGLVETLLQVARSHKAPRTICECATCLYQLMQDRESWPRVVAADGLRLLVDMLGPPPSSILKHELTNWRHLIDPVYAAQLKKEQEAAKAAEEQRLREQAAARAATEAEASKHGSRATSAKPGFKPSRSMSAQGDAANAAQLAAQKAAELAAAQKQDPDPRTLLSINSCGLKWHSTPIMATYSAAAGCLYEMCQNTNHMHVISRRLAASRLVPLLQICMEAETDAKKKKAKKKGLSLTPEQIEALTNIVGCLKFLSLVNTNRYRIAHLYGAKFLKPIYEECSHTLLRRNAQVVLSNIAMIAENGTVLFECKLPEEFLLAKTMRLSPEEVEQLALEFPDNRLVENAAEHAATVAQEAAARVSKFVAK